MSTVDSAEQRRRKKHRRDVKYEGNYDAVLSETTTQDHYQAKQLVTSTMDLKVHASTNAGDPSQDKDAKENDNIPPETINKILFEEIRSQEQWKQEADCNRKEFSNTLQNLRIGRSLNYMIIGTPGIGKTSFLNTIAASIYGSFNELFEIGGGKRDAVSPKIRKAEKCGLRKILSTTSDIWEDDDITKLMRITPYPSYIDVPGLPQRDHSSEDFREAIRALMFGRVPDGEKIIGSDGLLSLTADEIKKRYPYRNADKEMQPDVVFILASAIAPPPEAMLEDIMAVLQPKENEGYYSNLRVCGVITKIDRVTDWKEYRKMKDRFIHSLNLEGKVYALLELQNYANVRPGESRPRIDANVLDFLMISVSPGMLRDDHGRDDVALRAKEEQLSTQAIEILQRNWYCAACCFFVVIYLVGVISFLGVVVILALMACFYLSQQDRVYNVFSQENE
ncbi:unnamed protein product [Owenia fusiformis]|uniref:Uncharacterized protein n=1 Tax=Owenia fusiformis TaxID=6347 RepID=A0A8J1TD78_OWEFU|nr:unnamed protein product [Owenia fusiformis]